MTSSRTSRMKYTIIRKSTLAFIFFLFRDMFNSVQSSVKRPKLDGLGSIDQEKFGIGVKNFPKNAPNWQTPANSITNYTTTANIVVSCSEGVDKEYQRYWKPRIIMFNILHNKPALHVVDLATLMFKLRSASEAVLAWRKHKEYDVIKDMTQDSSVECFQSKWSTIDQIRRHVRIIGAATTSTEPSGQDGPFVDQYVQVQGNLVPITAAIQGCAEISNIFEAEDIAACQNLYLIIKEVPLKEAPPHTRPDGSIILTQHNDISFDTVMTIIPYTSPDNRAPSALNQSASKFEHYDRNCTSYRTYYKDPATGKRSYIDREGIVIYLGKTRFSYEAKTGVKNPKHFMTTTEYLKQDILEVILQPHMMSL